MNNLQNSHGSPCGQAVISSASLSLDHLTNEPGMGSSPTLGTCETSQDLFAGVSGVFSLGYPVFAQS